MGWEAYFKVLGFTFLLLGVFLFFVYVFKRGRMQTLAKGGKIRIEEVRPLGFKAQLVLVKVRDRTFFLGISEKGVELFREWKDDEEA